MRHLIAANAGLLFAGLATFVMMGAGQSLYGPALPAFAREMNLTEARAGLLVSAHWVGCAIGIALMYGAGHRITPRHVLAVMAAGAAIIALGAGWWPTVAGALVFGCGYGLATAVFNPRILRAFGDRGTSMLSLLNATFGVGAIAAPLVFVALGSVPANSFALVAGLAAVIWLCAGPAGRIGTPEASAGPRGRFRPPFGFLLFAVAGIGTEASLIGLGPTALIAAGIPEARAAELLSAFFVTFLGARVVLVFVGHLVVPFLLYAGAMAGAAACAVLAATVTPGVFFVAMGACVGLFFPGFYVAASRVMGEDMRTAPTIIAAGLVGGIAAPIILGAMMGAMGERGFFWVIAGVTLVTTLAAGVVAPRVPR